MSTKLSAIVIGAGPAGLLSAVLLQQRGYDVVLSEQRSEEDAFCVSESRTYTVDITGHGIEALKAAKCLSPLSRDLFPFRGIRVRCGIVSTDEPFNGGGLTGSRGDICGALFRELMARNSTSGSCTKVLFSTVAYVRDATAGSVTLHTDGQLPRDQAFDLIVAADGAGSAARRKLNVDTSKGRNSNHSSMMRLDRADALDPAYLYVLGMPPVMLVAGAVRDRSKTGAAAWYCQIGIGGEPPEFDGPAAARGWLEVHASGLLPFASPASLDEWSRRPFADRFFSTGRYVLCEKLTTGRCVLIGDAGGAFIPIGQGLNAALESAATLDRCLGRPGVTVSAALQQFEREWLPEVRAAASISMQLDISRVGVWQMIRTLVLSKLGLSAVQNAKLASLSYQDAVSLERRATFIGWLVLLLMLVGLWLHCCW